MSDASTDFIAVQVPARYVTRVYELISRLEREDAEISDAENAPPAPALTKELVARMYRESKESHEQLMLYLADHAGEWQTTREIAKALGEKRGTVGAYLSTFSRRATNRYGGVKPWESRDIADGSQVEHRMTPEVAEWVKEASAKVGS
ncbi:MAG: hypothetical protein KDB57_04975 [Solirubrobacterales bacterium]|nr:hypothetical protein [Solirubrobacterales bacterium]